MKDSIGACLEELRGFENGTRKSTTLGRRSIMSKVWKRLDRCWRMKKAADTDGGKRKYDRKSPSRESRS